MVTYHTFGLTARLLSFLPAVGIEERTLDSFSSSFLWISSPRALRSVLQKISFSINRFSSFHFLILLMFTNGGSTGIILGNAAVDLGLHLQILFSSLSFIFFLCVFYFLRNSSSFHSLYFPLSFISGLFFLGSIFSHLLQESSIDEEEEKRRKRKGRCSGSYRPALALEIEDS